MSVTLTPCSRSRSWSSCARVMSADIEIWNAGASQASVRRRAIVLRSDVSGTTSASSGAAAAGACAGAGDAARERGRLDAPVRSRRLLGLGLRLLDALRGERLGLRRILLLLGLRRGL